MSRRPDPERRAAQKELIAAAAARLFAQRGFERTTAADIARAAGVSSGAIFYYFEDKRALFRFLFELDLPKSVALIERHAEAAEPLAAVLDIVEELAAAAEDPLLPGLLSELMRQLGQDPQLAELVEASAGVLQSGLARLIARGISAGEIDPEVDPSEAAWWLHALLDGLYLNADPLTAPSLRGGIRRLASRYLSKPVVPSAVLEGALS